jgi:hypothetical protein
MDIGLHRSRDLWPPRGRGRRLGKIVSYTLAASLIGLIGLVALVAIFRDELVTLDD